MKIADQDSVERAVQDVIAFLAHKHGLKSVFIDAPEEDGIGLARRLRFCTRLAAKPALARTIRSRFGVHVQASAQNSIAYAPSRKAILAWVANAPRGAKIIACIPARDLRKVAHQCKSARVRVLERFAIHPFWSTVLNKASKASMLVRAWTIAYRLKRLAQLRLVMNRGWLARKHVLVGEKL